MENINRGIRASVIADCVLDEVITVALIKTRNSAKVIELDGTSFNATLSTETLKP